MERSYNSRRKTLSIESFNPAQHHHFDLDPVEAWGVKKIAWPNDFGAGGSKGHYKVLLLQSPTRKRAQKLGKQQIQLELTEYNQVQLKM